ncbi:MAG: cupin domain-containing protein [Oscillospiraceae bacterium]
MNDMKLSYFTNDESFPLFVQFGAHDVPLFVHGHEDFYELVTVLDGSAEHIVDGERSVISKGDVFVIGNGISHGFDNTHGLRVCNIMYRPEMLFPATWISKDTGIPRFSCWVVFQQHSALPEPPAADAC